MTKTTQSRGRIATAIFVGVVASLLGLLLLPSERSQGNPLSRASYDSLHNCASPPELTAQNSQVVIIYLDLESYFANGQDPAKPWSRALHAELVRKLKAVGARAVVFDILADQPSATPVDDIQLADAIQENGKVILAAELNASSHLSGTNEWTKALKLLLPHAPLLQSAAGWGLASLAVDEDFTVRRHFPGYPKQNELSLTWAAGRFLNLDSVRIPEQAGAYRWMRYYGPALTVPHVSYHTVGETPPEFFRDKIVFIGARPIVGLFNERRDELRNPLASSNDNQIFMPAVEVHATQMLNLLRGDWLQRLPGGEEAALIIAAGLLFGAGLLWLRPIPATIATLGGAGAVLGCAVYGFSRGVWFPWLIVCAVQAPVSLLGSILYSFVDWYRTRKSLERARRISEAKIREQAALIEKAHDAIVVEDLRGCVVYVNRSAERLYGWSLKDLEARGNLDKLLSADRNKSAAARSAVLSKGEWNGELAQQNKKGQTIIVASRWTLIRDESENPRALLVISSDITDKKQLEAQLLRTQRMETIGSLAGGMAHDLNNALSPILMGVQLLRRKTEDEESRRLLSLMETSTHRGADMVRQVLLFARGKEGDFQRLAIGPLIKEIEKIVRETFPRNVSVESFLANDLWPVHGNSTQLHQVLLNLCVNARDAMPEGGRLTLAADNVELSGVDATANPQATPGSYVSIMVSDTGCGMPKEVSSKIFEPFFTTKGEGHGTGLGLATVQRIMKGHGGFVRLESAVGEGTTFEVLLPRTVEKETIQELSPRAYLPTGHGELILVVDDELAIRDVLTEGLSAYNYSVLTASDGKEAIELLRQNPLVGLVITDSEMPHVNGPHAIEVIRKLRPDLPVICTGGQHLAESEQNARVLKKPFSLEQILTLIAQILAGPDRDNPAKSLGKT